MANPKPGPICPYIWQSNGDPLDFFAPIRGICVEISKSRRKLRASKKAGRRLTEVNRKGVSLLTDEEFISVIMLVQEKAHIDQPIHTE